MPHVFRATRPRRDAHRCRRQDDPHRILVMTTLAEEDPYTQCTYVIDRAGQISKSFVKLGSLGKKYYEPEKSG
jgi:hypothetical protein